jgi:hypothetical protein
MKQIVILGSKPNPKIPKGDAIYCANGAAAGHEQIVGAFAERSVIAPCGLVHRGLSPNLKPNAVDVSRSKTVCAFNGRRTIIFGKSSDVRFAAVKAALLDAGQPDSSIKFMNRFEQHKLVRNSLGKYPVLDKRFFQQPISAVVRDSARLALCKLLWALKLEKDAPPQYSPSTGIIALLVALREHGPSAKYVLAGIGLSNRDQYIVDNTTIELNRVHQKAFPKHIVADIIILQHLAKSWHIVSTESDFEGLLPVVSA